MFHLAFVVAAVQAGRDICAHGGEGLPRDDFLADGGLYGHFEELTWDNFV